MSKVKIKKCELQGCGRPARKRFCCNKHKDRYHNIHNPRGIYAHLSSGGHFYNNPHASGDEGHGQE